MEATRLTWNRLGSAGALGSRSRCKNGVGPKGFSVLEEWLQGRRQQLRLTPGRSKAITVS